MGVVYYLIFFFVSLYFSEVSWSFHFLTSYMMARYPLVPISGFCFYKTLMAQCCSVCTEATYIVYYVSELGKKTEFYARAALAVASSLAFLCFAMTGRWDLIKIQC